MAEQTKDPTELEIADRCLAIQARWSAVERGRRIVGPSYGVAVPTFSAGELGVVEIECED